MCEVLFLGRPTKRAARAVPMACKPSLVKPLSLAALMALSCSAFRARICSVPILLICSLVKFVIWAVVKA